MYYLILIYIYEYLFGNIVLSTNQQFSGIKKTIN